MQFDERLLQKQSVSTSSANGCCCRCSNNSRQWLVLSSLGRLLLLMLLLLNGVAVDVVVGLAIALKTASVAVIGVVVLAAVDVIDLPRLAGGVDRFFLLLLLPLLLLLLVDSASVAVITSGDDVTADVAPAVVVAVLGSLTLRRYISKYS